jgi:cytidylate kinase
MTRATNREPVVIEIDESSDDSITRRLSADAPRELLVTIDGPAGTGKSTVARELAHKLGVDFLDTGAMYRAATALAIDAGIPREDEQAVVELLAQADLRFDWGADPPTLLAFKKSVMHRLRDPDVTAEVSPVSALPGVREILVHIQRRIGSQHARLVSEGRDQGSVVFPDADVKIYLDASPRVRAQRRAAQSTPDAAPQDAAAAVDRIEQEIAERDQRDMSRAVGPLVCPKNAVRFDTSKLSRAEVVAGLFEIVTSTLAKRKGGKKK